MSQCVRSRCGKSESERILDLLSRSSTILSAVFVMECCFLLLPLVLSFAQNVRWLVFVVTDTSKKWRVLPS